jgi:hypothetical protein
MLKDRVKLKLTESSASKGKLRSRFRTCAVVSSSGVLKRHNLGPDIDKADLVIRFNDAPTAGYEKYVGRKEGVRFVNGKETEYTLRFRTDRYINKTNGISYVVVPMTSKINLEAVRKKFSGVEWFQIAKSMPVSFRKLLEAVYWSDRYVFHEGRGSSTPTSGAMGMIVAMSLCDEVRGYGMASSRQQYNSAYHYYDTEGKAHVNYWHKGFNIEKDLWRRLATNSFADIDKRDVAVIPGFSRAKCPR